MFVTIPGFYSEQDKIDCVQILITKARTEIAVCFNGGVNAHLFATAKQSDGKTILHQRFTSAQGEPTMHRLQSMPILSNSFDGALQQHRNSVHHVPGVRVVTVQASPLAARR